MVKVRIRVRCYGWTGGAYENTLYFKTEEDARRWAANKPHVTIKEITPVN